MAFVSLCTDVPPPQKKIAGEESEGGGTSVNMLGFLSTYELLPADTSSTDKAPNAVLSKTF